MRFRSAYVWAFTALLGLALPARADFYATDWSQSGSPSNLYTLNASTGVATLVGSTGVPRLVGIAADSGGTLYSVSESDVNAISSILYTVNATTGVATPVGALGAATAEGDLAFDPSTGTLYVADALHDNLLTVDKTTGLATVVGSFGAAGRDVSGLMFSGGILYGLAMNDANPDTLVTIDTATGAATTVGTTGTDFGIIGALGQDPVTNKAYIAGPASIFGSDNQLWQVDLATGAATLSTAITGITASISGLSPIPSGATTPEPSSIVLAGVGLAGLGLASVRARIRKIRA